MQLFVKTVANRTLTIEVGPEDTVLAFMNKIKV